MGGTRPPRRCVEPSVRYLEREEYVLVQEKPGKQGRSEYNYSVFPVPLGHVTDTVDPTAVDAPCTRFDTTHRWPLISPVGPLTLSPPMRTVTSIAWVGNHMAQASAADGSSQRHSHASGGYPKLPQATPSYPKLPIPSYLSQAPASLTGLSAARAAVAGHTGHTGFRHGSSTEVSSSPAAATHARVCAAQCAIRSEGLSTHPGPSAPPASSRVHSSVEKASRPPGARERAAPCVVHVHRVVSEGRGKAGGMRLHLA